MKLFSKLGIAVLLLVVSSVLIAGFLYAYSEPAVKHETGSSDQETRKG